MKKIMIFAALMMAVGSSAYAQRRGGGNNGVYLGLGLMYEDGKDKAEVSGVTAPEAKSTSTILDADLGYVFSSGLYLGAAYISSNVDAGGVKPKSSALGAGIGYARGGFLGKVSYYLNGTAEDGGADKWSEGKGLGVDVGYLFPVSSSFNLGASLAYRSIKYTKLESSGVDVSDSSLESTRLSPRLLFAFTF